MKCVHSVIKQGYDPHSGRPMGVIGWEEPNIEYHLLRRWRRCNEALETNVGQSKDWGAIDFGYNSYVDWQTSWGRFEELEAVVLAAQTGREKDPKATLWHWAVRCNKTWLISQFLRMPIACESLMTLDSNNKTALEIAIACGNTAIEEMLQSVVTRIAAEKEAARIAAEKAAAEAAAKIAFPKLSLAELLKVCRAAEPHHDIAKQVLQEKLREKLSTLELDLTNKALTPEDIATLVSMVESQKHALAFVLQKINLSQNMLGETGFIALFPFLKLCGDTLQELNISHCGLTDKSIKGFLKNCLPELIRLFVLNVAGNPLSAKVKAILQEDCKRIELEIDDNLPTLPLSPIQLASDATSSYSGGSKKESSVPSMPWGDPVLLFPAPTREEQEAQRRADLEELERMAPSVLGGETAYTTKSQTDYFLSFNSTSQEEIAKNLKRCIDECCMHGAEASFIMQNSKKQLLITLSASPEHQTKNNALLETLSQLLKRRIEPSATNTLLFAWSELTARHVKSCIPVFTAFYTALSSVEGAGLSQTQMTKILANIQGQLNRIEQKTDGADSKAGQIINALLPG